MNLGLDARIWNLPNLDRAPLLPRRRLDQIGELGHRELLGELIEDPIFRGFGRLLDRNLDASHSVPNVQIPSGLSTLAMHRERMSDRGFDTKAVQHRAPDAVVIEAGCQPC